MNSMVLFASNRVFDRSIYSYGVRLLVSKLVVMTVKLPSIQCHCSACVISSGRLPFSGGGTVVFRSVIAIDHAQIGQSLCQFVTEFFSLPLPGTNRRSFARQSVRN